MGKNIKYTFESLFKSGEWRLWEADTGDVAFTLGVCPYKMVACWCEDYGLAKKYPLVRDALEAYEKAEEVVAKLTYHENVSTETLCLANDLTTYTYDVLCRVIAELDNDDMVSMLSFSMDTINSIRLVSREPD